MLHGTNCKETLAQKESLSTSCDVAEKGDRMFCQSTLQKA